MTQPATPARDWIEAVAWIALPAALGVATRPWFSVTDQAMILLLGVIAAATRLPRGPAVLASVLSVAAFDFLFVPPYSTFNVEDLRYAFTFAVMLAVGMLVTTLAGRLREQAERTADLRLVAETERLRSELLSAVSHDLRTPLASITGAVTAVLRQPLTDTQRELLVTVREESDHLGRLVADLLDLTRIESGALRARREWHPVEDVVSGAIGRLDAALANRQVRVDVPEELLLAPMDPTLIEQVMVNLLENAAKYTDGAIDVVALREDGAVRIEVADRGPGIQEGQEERLFERFFRADDGHRSTGTGLGLTICRAIIGAHGGRIEAANREGGGAVFRFWLPVDLPPPEAL